MPDTLDKPHVLSYDYAALEKHALDASTPHQIEQALLNWSHSYALPQDAWIRWLDARQDALASLESIDDLVEHTLNLVRLYMQALDEHLSIPISTKFVRFAITQYCNARNRPFPKSQQETFDSEDDDTSSTKGKETVPQEQSLLAEVWTLDMVRNGVFGAVDRCAAHLVEGHHVWNLIRDFELDNLVRDPSPEQAEYVQNMYMVRLSQPHSEIDTTFQAYSNFVTKFANEDYEEYMVRATKLKSTAQQQWNERDHQERKLQSQQYSPKAYQAYLRWEQQVKSPAIDLVLNLFDRAVEQNRFYEDLWRDYQMFMRKYLRPERNKDGGGDINNNNDDDDDEDQDEDEEQDQKETIYFTKRIHTAIRATRNIPNSADIWSTYMGLSEQMGKINTVEPIFQQALSTRLFDKQPDQLATLYIAKADFHRRLQLLDLDPEQAIEYGVDVPDVSQVLNDAIQAVSKASKAGDPTLRLERYLAKHLELQGRLDQLVATWQKATKKYKNSASVWASYADSEARRGNISVARAIYIDAVSNPKLDYPLEYLYPSWLEFEHHYGDYGDIEYAANEFLVKQRILQARAARLNWKNQQQQQQQQLSSSSPQQQNNQGQEQGQDHEDQQPSEHNADKQPGMDDVQEINTKKRSAADLAENENDHYDARKKTKTEPVEELKRDRENSTVLVTASKNKEIDQDALRRLFRDCGEIREIKIYPRPKGDFVASVEFMDRTSVLPALTKDKKKIESNEKEQKGNADAADNDNDDDDEQNQIAVHQTWKSTLYITNFPQGTDDNQVREKFSKYGEILDTRWPSKRFKNTRRFCYVQYLSPTCAEKALELSGKAWDDTHEALVTVAISDPERKKTRSDADMDKKELKVDGIARSVTEKDLRSLFEKHGEITRIHLEKDEITAKAKGWAFIEFKDAKSATNALVLNNHELKHRHLAVTMVDSSRKPRREQQPQGGRGLRTARAIEARERTVRIVAGLPSGEEDSVQEALIQQVFEKHGPVKEVVFMEEKSAENEKQVKVEYVNMSDAGKVLLLPAGSLKYGEHDLTVVSESSVFQQHKPRQQKASSSSAAAAETTPSSFVPRQSQYASTGRGRGRRGGLGFGRRERGGDKDKDGDAMAVDDKAKTADDFRKMLS